VRRLAHSRAAVKGGEALGLNGTVSHDSRMFEVEAEAYGR